MKKKETKKVTIPNPIEDIRYLMHSIVSKLERMSDGRPIPYAELQMLHQDIDLLLKKYN